LNVESFWLICLESCFDGAHDSSSYVSLVTWWTHEIGCWRNSFFMSASAPLRTCKMYFPLCLSESLIQEVLLFRPWLSEEIWQKHINVNWKECISTFPFVLWLLLFFKNIQVLHSGCLSRRISILSHRRKWYEIQSLICSQ